MSCFVTLCLILLKQNNSLSLELGLGPGRPSGLPFFDPQSTGVAGAHGYAFHRRGRDYTAEAPLPWAISLSPYIVFLFCMSYLFFLQCEMSLVWWLIPLETLVFSIMPLDCGSYSNLKLDLCNTAVWREEGWCHWLLPGRWYRHPGPLLLTPEWATPFLLDMGSFLLLGRD